VTEASAPQTAPPPPHGLQPTGALAWDAHVPASNVGRGKSVSFVYPAFNEEENVTEAVRRAVEAGELVHLDAFEVIVVDDGSADATWAVLERLARDEPRLRPIRHEKNQGYAAALRTGFTAARFPLVFYSDSDNQYDIREIRYLLPLSERHDIVTGFRDYRFDPLTRLVLSWGFNLLVRIIFRIPVRDIDCAFKIFRREIFDKITIESQRFFVDTEILAKAKALGMTMTEIGVRHYPRMAGRSTVRPMHIVYTLRELAKIWGRIYLR
jgi:glycosyltransferase involved in cell wall biosynthesis